MKKLTAKIAILIFVVGLLAAGLSSCTDDYGDYGDYGDVYGGVSSQE
jgi:hypothetical protein